MTRICLSIVLLILVILAGSASAQLSKSDIDALAAQGERDGWTFTVGENPATQYSIEELCGMKEPPNWRDSAVFDPMLSVAQAALPTSFDWRNYNGTTPIRNQGGCGSCWAFATVGPLECNIKIRDGIDVNLSEQWLVSCNRVGWDCGGGWYAHAYHMNAMDGCLGTGAVLEANFPYVGYDAACNCPYPHNYFISGWAYIGNDHSVAGVEQIKQAILEYGPVSVSIYVNNAFQAYRGGVFNSCETGVINHAVTVVGWDDTQGQAGVWIVRNSWGTYWGESGYMRIPYGCNQVGYAACYIRYRPINITASDELGSSPLAVDFDMAVDWATVSACEWDFGDGSTSTEAAPSHEYGAPGYYDIKLNITTAEGDFRQISPGMVSVYADTMQAPQLQVSTAAQVIKVNVYAHNYLALKQIKIPFTWEGALNLKFDSFSVAGTRTSGFENCTALNYDPGHYRATISLAAGTSAPLAAGSGTVASLWFTAPGGYSGSNPIQFISYAGHEPTFYAFGGEYIPVLNEGLLHTGVSVSCCQGRVGDVNLSGEDEPTLGDISAIVDHMFINPRPYTCTEEADINHSGGANPTFDDITLGDISLLVDYLFINGTPLPDCL